MFLRFCRGRQVAICLFNYFGHDQLCILKRSFWLSYREGLEGVGGTRVERRRGRPPDLQAENWRTCRDHCPQGKRKRAEWGLSMRETSLAKQAENLGSLRVHESTNLAETSLFRSTRHSSFNSSTWHKAGWHWHDPSSPPEAICPA